MKTKILFLPLLLLAVACSNSKQDAEDMLSTAERHFLSGNYAEATQWIDSISAVYPHEVDVIREGMMLQCKVNQMMYEEELIRVDSLYNVAKAEVEALKPQFVLVREGKEQTLANYVYKGYESNGAVSKSGLRAQVTEKGDFQLTSIYYGGSKINHTGISVNGVASKAIAYDGAKNYRYTTGGNVVEMVTYNMTQCRDVADAIANASGKLAVNYTGGKKYSVTLDGNHRKAIADTYRLACALAQTDSLQSCYEYSKLQVELADRQLMKLEEQTFLE